MDSVLSAILLAVTTTIVVPPASAQVYEWRYVDPNRPSLGKRESSKLTLDGATADVGHEIGLRGRDLTKAYLAGAQLPRYRVGSTILDDAYLAGANLYNLQGDDLTARGADFSGAELGRARLNGADLSDSSFRGADLSGAFMSNAILAGADLGDANVAGARLSGTTALGLTAKQLYSTASYQSGELADIEFHGNDLRGWDFSRVSLLNADLGRTQLDGADLSDARIDNADLSESTLTSTQLYSTASYKAGDVGRVDLRRMDLRGWDFTGVSMIQAEFRNSDLDGTVFDGAILANAAIGRQHDEIAGTTFRNADLSNARFEVNGRWRQVDFTGANLTGARLANTGFVASAFDDATIQGADMQLMTLWGFTLENLYSTASYKSGDLQQIVLSDNDLSGADFRGTDLSGATFRGANLDGANFRGAIASGASFGGRAPDGGPSGTRFDGAMLQGASFDYEAATSVSCRNADLSYAEFTNSVVGVDLTDAVIYGTAFAGPPLTVHLDERQLYSTASYQNRNLGPIQLKGDFRGWDFRRQDMSGAAFRRHSQLSGAKWDGANLMGASFFVSSLPDTDFRSVVVEETEFVSTDVRRGDFRGSNLSRASFTQASVVDARLDGTTWTNGVATRSDFAGARFANADLRRTQFISNNLAGVVFTQADIRGAHFNDRGEDTLTFSQIKATQSYQDADLSGVRLQGVNLPNENLSGFTLPRFEFLYGDASDSDFSRADLARSVFASADLSGATFADANLSRASFSNIQGLGSIDFSNANIYGARFYGLNRDSVSASQFYSTRSYQEQDLGPIVLVSNDLTGWDFAGQDLTGANFWSANLTDVRFTDAIIAGASFGGPRGRGLTASQFYSTRSYQDQDLGPITLASNDLTGWDFAGQDLTGANFRDANLADVRFTDAVLIGAKMVDATLAGGTFEDANLFGANLSGASGFLPAETTITRNMVWPDRSIRGLDLRTDESLILGSALRYRNYRVAGDIAIDSAATLTMRSSYDRSGTTYVPTLLVESETEIDLGGLLRIELDVVEDDYSQGFWEPEPRVLQLFHWPESLDAHNRFDAVDVPVGTLWDLAQLYTTGAVEFLQLGEPGDFIVDDELTAADIDLLSLFVTDPSPHSDLEFYLLDLNADGMLDGADRQTWVEVLSGTSFGDANLNGEVDFADFQALSAHFNQAGGWGAGDFDGDGMVLWSDFVILSNNYGHTNKIVAVPESPSGVLMLAVGFVFRAFRRSRDWSNQA